MPNLPGPLLLSGAAEAEFSGRCCHRAWGVGVGGQLCWLETNAEDTPLPGRNTVPTRLRCRAQCPPLGKPVWVGQPSSKLFFTDHLTFPENVLQEELKSYNVDPEVGYKPRVWFTSGCGDGPSSKGICSSRVPAAACWSRGQVAGKTHGGSKCERRGSGARCCGPRRCASGGKVTVPCRRYVRPPAVLCVPRHPGPRALGRRGHRAHRLLAPQPVDEGPQCSPRHSFLPRTPVWEAVDLP